jgi:hypothetical protein
MAQLIYKSEIAKDNALQLMFKMKLVLHILKAMSRTANICTCELRFFFSNRASTPFHYLNGNNKVLEHKTEVHGGEVGEKLAKQYQETHCVRSPSKRTLWGENLVPLIILSSTYYRPKYQGIRVQNKQTGDQTNEGTQPAE